MLTTTNKADLIAEIKGLCTQLDAFIYTAQAPLKAIKVGTFGPKGQAEMVRGLVQWSEPDEPQTPTETLWNALWSLEELTHETADIDRQGSVLYDRLLRMADLIELQA